MRGSNARRLSFAIGIAWLPALVGCGESSDAPPPAASSGQGGAGGSGGGSGAGTGGSSGTSGQAGSSTGGTGGGSGGTGGAGAAGKGGSPAGGAGSGGNSGTGAMAGGGSGGGAGAGGAGQAGAWGNTTDCAETLIDALTELPAGTMVDARDGRAYRTVQIGTQNWMAENLDYGTRVDGASGQTDDSAAEKYCVDDCEAACATLGGLYTWAEAFGLPTACNGEDENCVADITDPEPGICPDGWHLPDEDDWDLLEATVEAEVGEFYAGEALRSLEGWLDDPILGGDGNGTDAYDFRVLPVGVYSVPYVNFGLLGERAYFWVSSPSSSGVSRVRIFGNGQRAITSDSATKVQGLSVRCIED